MESNMDIYNILDRLEKTMRETVNSRYLEAVNEMNDGFNKLVERCLSNADTFDTSIRMAVRECKVHLTSSPTFKKGNYELSPNLSNQTQAQNIKESNLGGFEEQSSKESQSLYPKRSSIREEDFELNPNLSNQTYDRKLFDSNISNAEGNSSKNMQSKPSYSQLSAIRKRTDPIYENFAEASAHRNKMGEDGEETSAQAIANDQTQLQYDENKMDTGPDPHGTYQNNAKDSESLEEDKENWMRKFALGPSSNENNGSISHDSNELPLTNSDDVLRTCDAQNSDNFAKEELNGQEAFENGIINRSESERIFNECVNDKKFKMLDERMRREEEKHTASDEPDYATYQPKNDSTNVFYNNTNESSRITTRSSKEAKTPPRTPPRDAPEYQDMTSYSSNQSKVKTTLGVESGVVVTDTQVLDNGLIIKTYECKDCGMQSEFKNNIELHYKNKHATVKPYNCSFCDFGVARRDYLRTHIRKKHPEVEALKC